MRKWNVYNTARCAAHRYGSVPRPGTRDQGPGTRDQGPGTRDQGPWNMEHGPNVYPTTRCATRRYGSVPRPWTMEQGPWTKRLSPYQVCNASMWVCPTTRNHGPGIKAHGPNVCPTTSATSRLFRGSFTTFQFCYYGLHNKLLYVGLCVCSYACACVCTYYIRACVRAHARNALYNLY